jgi:hypothetical protein
MKYQDESDYLHKGKNCHSKYTQDKGLDIEYLKPDLKSKIKEGLEKSYREQLIILKEYKQVLLTFFQQIKIHLELKI